MNPKLMLVLVGIMTLGSTWALAHAVIEAKNTLYIIIPLYVLLIAKCYWLSGRALDKLGLTNARPLYKRNVRKKYE